MVQDVAVSMWHHTCSKNFNYTGPWDHFLDNLFLPGELESGPWWDFVIPYVKCEQGKDGTGRDEDGINVRAKQVLTVWYEDLMDDPVRELLRMADFLEVTLGTDSEDNDGFALAGGPKKRLKAKDIIQACSFSTMKKREETGGLRLPGRVAVADSTSEEEAGSTEVVCKNHIRKGGKGGWRKYFSAEQEERFNVAHARWLEQYGLTMTELQFE